MGMVIRVHGIKRVRAKGRLYYYHRRTGKRVPTELFAPGREHDLLVCIDRLNGKAKVAPQDGTLGALVAAYKGSPDFTQLAPRTRKDYNKVFDSLADIDGMPLDSELDEEFVLGVRDKAFKAHKRRFANYTVQVLSLLFSWGKPRGWCKRVTGNPAADIPHIRRPRKMPKANRAWKPHERDAIFAAAEAGMPQILVPLALGRWAGMTEGDTLRFSQRFYDGRLIDMDRGKTGQPLWLPAPTPLKAILDTTVEARKDEPVTSTCLAVNTRGLPWTESGFRRMFFKLVRKLQAEGKIGPGVTFHGLRHTMGKELADLGFDPETIAAYLSHATIDTTRIYTNEADKRRRVERVVHKLDRLHKAAENKARAKNGKLSG